MNKLREISITELKLDGTTEGLVFIEKSVADKLAEALESLVDECKFHNVCSTAFAVEVLKEYRGEE